LREGGSVHRGEKLWNIAIFFTTAGSAAMVGNEFSLHVLQTENKLVWAVCSIVFMPILYYFYVGIGYYLVKDDDTIC
jgi:hypothetical protein